MSRTTTRYLLSIIFIIAFFSKALAQPAYNGDLKTLNRTKGSGISDSSKLGLCLSGGGAKGLAHIGLLRMLDSLDIRPDYITGTSMGSIMGALYSIGYTGDELKEMALKTDWQDILSSKFPLKTINIEEKDEYGRYMLELPLNEFKPRLPKGAIEGQALQLHLLKLTYPVWQIQDFDSLPIPFRCMAVDAKTGKPVLLKKGNLADALRASMSVPLIFAPVEFEGQELIDGGVVRNFPVKEVIDMGANKVIGSYTGFRVLNADELNDAMAMVFQSAAFAFTQSTVEDKNACDVWVNNELPGLHSTSFKNARAMIEAGEVNARAMLPELKKIADWQHALGIQRPPRRILINHTDNNYIKSAIKQRSLQTIQKDTQALNPLLRITHHPSAINTDLSRNNREGGVFLTKLEISPQNSDQDITMRNLFNIEEGTTYQLEDLTEGLNNLYGSLFFERIFIDIMPDSIGKSRIILRARESRQNVAKIGLHYDSDDAAGILLNLTMRNWIASNSRLVVTGDLAEQPKGHINYYQFIGVKGRWRWVFDLLAEQTRQNDFLFIKASEGKLKSRDKYIRRYFQASVGVQRILNKNTLAFVEFRREYASFHPQRNPLKSANPASFSFLESEDKNWNIVAGIQYNNKNTIFFPTEGNQFYLQTRWSFNGYGKFTTYLYNDTSKIGRKSQIVTAQNQSYLHYLVSDQQMLPLSKKWTLGIQAGVGAGFSLSKSLPANQPDTLPLDNPQAFLIGGIEPTVRDQEVPFIGLRRAELSFGQFMRLGISAQYNFAKHMYLTPTANIGKFADSHRGLYNSLLEWDFKSNHDSVLTPRIQTGTTILGYGLELGYNTRFGPFRLAAHSNTYTNSVYVYFSMGFRFF